MSDNVNEVLGEIQNAVTELRNTNEANLKSRDTVLEGKMDTINAAIDELQKKAARPSFGAEISQEVSEHKTGWNKWARKGAGEHELEALERKAVTISGTDAPGLAAGGYLLPETVEAGIYKQLEVLSPIRAASTVVNVSSGDYRFLSASGNFEAGWVGETDARPETATNTLAETRVPMGELYANPHASQWALDDAAFNLEAYMADEIAISFAKKENAAFIGGDGVNKPMGIMTTSGIASVKSGVAYTSGGAGMPTTGDAYISMVYALGAAYRAGSSFVMASASQASVRLLKDTTGSYIWQNSLIAGQPDTLLGYNLIVAEEMPALAANASPVLFGNLKQGYLIVDRIGIRSLRDPFSKKPFVGFYTTKRLGGMVKDKAAFVSLKVSA